MSKVPVVGRGKVWIGVIIAVILVLGSLLSYNYIIPRVELDVKLMCIEAPLGVTNVVILFRNEGTVDLSDVNVTLGIRDEAGRLKADEAGLFDEIGKGSRTEMKLNFSGDQYLDHVLTLNITFYGEGKRYCERWTIRDDGKYMRWAFERSVKDWFP